MVTPSQQERRLQQCINKLNRQDRDGYLTTTVDEVLLANQSLLRKRSTCSRTLHLCNKLNPIIVFLQHYAKAIDVMAQQSGPVALAWGCIRVLLESVDSHNSYIAFLVSTMEEISDKLHLFQRYDGIYSDWTPFRDSLTNVHYHIVIFLLRVNETLRSGTFKLFRKTFAMAIKKEIQGSLDAIARHTRLLERETELVHHQITHSEIRKRIMDWLSPVDVMHDSLRAREKRTDGTCHWIFKNRAYLDWRDEKTLDRVLWLSGRPGSGKTVLFSSVVQNLQQNLPEGCVAHFYIGLGDNRSEFVNAIATIIAQLVACQSLLSSELVSAFESAARYGRNRLSRADQPMKVLIHLLQAQKMTYLALDGIDECMDLENTLVEISALSKVPNLRILITSRDIPEVRNCLSQHSAVTLSTALIRDDINLFLRAGLNKIFASFEQDDLVDKVLPRLLATADGSFLWAHLMLCTLKQTANVNDLLRASQQLPKDLEAIYESSLQQLNQKPCSTRSLGRNLLCWICFSRRPLKWKELEYALSLDETFNEATERRPFKAAVLRLCNPLVEYDDVLDEFRPLHWSVCEFLAQKNESDFFSHERLSGGFVASTAHSIIVKACIKSISQKRNPDAPDMGVIKQTPLARYATLHWCSHLLQASITPDTRHMTETFMSNAANRKAWVAQYMLLQLRAFPLQAVLRQLRDVNAWLIKASTQSEVCAFDILHDTLDIIHGLAVQFLDVQLSPNLQPSVGHFDTMMAVRDLARAYTQAGRLPDAVLWLEGALEGVQGSDHMADNKRAWILNSLGIIYDQQTRSEAAIETQRRALVIQKARLGTEHLHVAWTKNELGRVFRHVWKLTDSEQMHLEALHTLEIHFPESDPHVMWTKNTLARTYRFQGRFDESLRFHQQTFDVQAGTLGSIHCHTLWTLSDVARCLRDRGNTVMACETFLKVLEGRLENLGDQHPDTLWSMNDVGLLLSLLGKPHEATKYHEKAYTGQLQCLGREHEHTKWTETVLAGCPN
ncbi:unnamed protein product [Periconia digitata]|uniref:NACHT domain-containing protein n=1 Tax=Periconia digitata TaxID=1303443 RepID=A0A9W4XHZ6_9PLEO|nr:unnamed protein product [Periconia digitata]